MTGASKTCRLLHGEGSTFVRVTASIGVVYCEYQDGNLAEMMAVADEELYKSKQGGRDRFSMRYAS